MKAKKIEVRLMVGGDNHATLLRYILNAVKLNLPSMRLNPPTTGLILSSAHCGNIAPPFAGRAVSFFTENVLLLTLNLISEDLSYNGHSLSMNST